MTRKNVFTRALLSALLFGCAGADYSGDEGQGDELGQVEQAATGACLETPINHRQWGIQGAAGTDLTVQQRCDMQTSGLPTCYFSNFSFGHVGFRVNLADGWSTSDRDVVTVAWGRPMVQWMKSNFPYRDPGEHFNRFIFCKSSTSDTTCYGDSTSPLSSADAVDYSAYVFLSNVSFNNPSWWNNRATTTQIRMNDLVQILCTSSFPLTEPYPGSARACTRIVVNIDYSKLKTWTADAGINTDKVMNTIFRRVAARSLTLGSNLLNSSVDYDEVTGNSVRGSVTASVFRNEAYGSELSWANNPNTDGNGLVCVAE